MQATWKTAANADPIGDMKRASDALFWGMRTPPPVWMTNILNRSPFATTQKELEEFFKIVPYLEAHLGMSHRGFVVRFERWRRSISYRNG